MANKSSTLTGINLTSSINLNKVKSEINPYNEMKFNKKNSLFWGNAVQPWYRNKNIQNYFYNKDKITIDSGYIAVEDYDNRTASARYYSGIKGSWEIDDKEYVEEEVYINDDRKLVLRDKATYPNAISTYTIPYGYEIKSVRPAKAENGVSYVLCCTGPVGGASLTDYSVHEISYSSSGIDEWMERKQTFCNFNTQIGFKVSDYDESEDDGYNIEYVDFSMVNHVKFTDIFIGAVVFTREESPVHGGEIVNIFINRKKNYTDPRSNYKFVEAPLSDVYIVDTKTSSQIAITYNVLKNAPDLPEEQKYKYCIAQVCMFGLFVTYSCASGGIRLPWVFNDERAFYATNSSGYSTHSRGFTRKALLTRKSEGQYYWAGGVKSCVETHEKISPHLSDTSTFALYNYGGVLEGLSNCAETEGRSQVLTRNVKEFAFSAKTGAPLLNTYLVFKTNKDVGKRIWHGGGGMSYYNNYKVKNLILSERNGIIFDLEKKEFSNRSDDYNNRAIPYRTDVNEVYTEAIGVDFNTSIVRGYDKNASFYYFGSSLVVDGVAAKYNFQSVYEIQVASCKGGDYYQNGKIASSSLYPPVTVHLTGFNQESFDTLREKIDFQLGYEDGGYSDTDVECYVSNVAGGTPVFYKMLNGKDKGLEKNITSYPIDMNGNVLLCSTITDEFHELWNNQMLVTSDEGKTYFTPSNADLQPITGYYLLSMTDFKNCFLLNGQWYGINDKYIFSFSMENQVATNISICANIESMKFVGATTNQAFFFSSFDNCIYAFSGMISMQKVFESTSIKKIKDVYYNPSIELMTMLTDIGLIVVYQQQVCLIEDILYEESAMIKDLYFDVDTIYCYKNGISLTSNLIGISSEDTEINPIVFETEMLGEGNEVKSINDCVYVRFAGGGTIKVQSKTLNEKQFNSTEKQITLTEDEESKTSYLRYQPQYQASTGFALRIESVAPIMTLSISHKTETIQNSSNNI